MKEKNAKIRNVEVKYDRAGRRHLLASRTISSGETLLSIPIECTIFDSMHTDDPMLKEIQQKTEPRVALAILLTAEAKNTTSKFRSFLESIPAKITNYLAYYTDAEFAMAKGSTLMYEREMWLFEFEEIYKKASANFAGFEARFKKDELMKALIVIDAYAIPIEIRGTKRLSLIPFLCIAFFLIL